MKSIIIPIHNAYEITTECLNSVLANTIDYEIIIIDNGSDEPFKIPFTGFTDIRVIRNEENKGFPVAVNQGIEESKGDIIVLLNNDVIVTPGWADRLEVALNSGFDIVGPVTNYCAGMQKVQIDNYENTDQLNASAYEWSEQYGDHVQEVNFIIGFCMMFKKSIYNEIGPFDESMWPCSGEEVDFCLEARKKGYRIGIVEGCYVHHEGSTTFKELQAKGVADYGDICKKVDDHIEKKWGKDYWSRQDINSSPLPVGLCLNLGCGLRKIDGYINIDNRPEVNPDIVHDIILGLPYKENTVDVIRAYDFLEHIQSDRVIDVITEIWQVLKPGGIFESLTPDAENGQGAFQDPHHVSFWTENSWLYYSNKEYRELYDIKADFNIVTFERLETGNRVFHLHVIAKKR